MSRAGSINYSTTWTARAIPLQPCCTCCRSETTAASSMSCGGKRSHGKGKSLVDTGRAFARRWHGRELGCRIGGALWSAPTSSSDCSSTSGAMHRRSIDVQEGGVARSKVADARVRHSCQHVLLHGRLAQSHYDRLGAFLVQFSGFLCSGSTRLTTIKAGVPRT